MAEWYEDPVIYAAVYGEWIDEYEIDTDNSIDNGGMTQEQHDMLVELDKQKLVWTEHGTCEDNEITPGFKVFGDCSLLKQTASGCGCWQSHYYYIGKKPWSDENERVKVDAYLPCSVCNPEGEDDGVEGCEGPEPVEGAGRSDCDSGFINWYFD